jgi:hypothetical protein
MLRNLHFPRPIYLDSRRLQEISAQIAGIIVFRVKARVCTCEQRKHSTVKSNEGRSNTVLNDTAAIAKRFTARHL